MTDYNHETNDQTNKNIYNSPLNGKNHTLPSMLTHEEYNVKKNKGNGICIKKNEKS